MQGDYLANKNKHQTMGQLHSSCHTLLTTAHGIINNNNHNNNDTTTKMKCKRSSICSSF